MKRLHGTEQTTNLLAFTYLGMAMENSPLGAPKERLYMNRVFTLIGGAVLGVLYLLRKQRERAQAT